MSTSENKTNPWLWWLLALTVLLTAYMRFQPVEEVDEVLVAVNAKPKSMQQTVKPRKSRRQPQQEKRFPVPDDLIPDAVLSRTVNVKSVGNAFVPKSWYVAPVIEETVINAPPPEPKAPAIPFKYVGKFNEYQLCLEANNKLYTVEVGDIVKGVWRIERDEPYQLVMTYIPLNQTVFLRKPTN